MAVFRKKPVEIEAVKVSDLLREAESNWGALPAWVRDEYEKGGIVFGTKAIHIGTLEGEMTGQLDDWVIRGVKGEIYPCKPDIFEATYDRVESDGAVAV